MDNSRGFRYDGDSLTGKNEGRTMFMAEWKEKRNQTEESMGTRLAQLRRGKNITQEELAERLDISRQAVSKWESDLAFPETDKLLTLSRLYGCTVDYLLTGETPAATSETGDPPESPNLWERIEKGWGKRPRYFEYKSRRTIRGIPLVHVNVGFGRRARGIVAVGLSARGVLSVGLVSAGVLSAGLCSAGILSVGILALGLLLAVGSIAVGLIAVGAIAAGILAIGALSAGLISVGAFSIGQYLAVGDHAYGMIAVGDSVAAGKIFSGQGLTAAELEARLSELFALAERHLPPVLRGIAKGILRGIV